MTPELKKTFNIFVGTTFAVLGLACLGLAAFMATVPSTPKPAPVSPLPIISTSACREVLQQMGYTASLTSGGGVLAKEISLEDPQGSLVKATAAIGMCKLPMTEFCMGSGCPEPGLTFTLAPKKPDTAQAPTPGAIGEATKAKEVPVIAPTK